MLSAPSRFLCDTLDDAELAVTDASYTLFSVDAAFCILRSVLCGRISTPQGGEVER